jgi:hypothetical protein
METTQIEEITLEELTDVTGGGCVRNAILGAGAAIGILTSGVAIGPMTPGPSSAPTSISCPIGQK